jgi:hypothetical protein
MWEVDLAIGKGSLDAPLALRLYLLLQLKEKLPAITIEEMCALFTDINTAFKFTEAYQRREPSLYERLFLNKRLSNPIDAAFSVTPASSPTMDHHVPPVLAALRVNDTDLAIFRRLIKPGNGPRYIEDALTLANLSFLYRHAPLSKSLHIKAWDWKTLLFIMQQDVFADPATALTFVKLLERVRAAKLSIDQLGYILTADRTAKSAVSCVDIG